MALAKSLSIVQPTLGRRGGCSTCRWYQSLPPADKAAFWDWIDSGRSITQLWEVASKDPDHPLTMGISALRLHLRTCKRDES